MKNKKLCLSIILLIFTMLFAFSGCDNTVYDIPEEDKIVVNIQLDLDEDIGLLITDWNINGQTGTSGVINADKSKIIRDSNETWEFDRFILNKEADTYELKLKFTIVTEYFEPNYEFDYPEEYTIPTNEISFTAEFGKTYSVIISGGQQNGYNAVLKTQQ